LLLLVRRKYDNYGIYMKIKTILLVGTGAIATVILYFVAEGNGGFAQWTTAATSFAPIPEVTPASVIFGFVGLAVAVSSRRFLAERSRSTARKRV
jgi:hypothetical protein